MYVKHDELYIVIHVHWCPLIDFGPVSQEYRLDVLVIPFAIFPQFPSEYARLEGCQIAGGQVNRTEVHCGYMSDDGWR